MSDQETYVTISVAGQAKPELGPKLVPVCVHVSATVNRLLKASLSFFFGVLWFVVTFAGVAILAIPQIIMTAYGSDARIVDVFMDFMETILNSFSEI